MSNYCYKVCFSSLYPFLHHRLCTRCQVLRTMLNILQCLGQTLNSDPHKEAPNIEIPGTPFTLRIHDNVTQRQVGACGQLPLLSSTLVPPVCLFSLYSMGLASSGQPPNRFAVCIMISHTCSQLVLARSAPYGTAPFPLRGGDYCAIVNYVAYLEETQTPV